MSEWTLERWLQWLREGDDQGLVPEEIARKLAAKGILTVSEIRNDAVRAGKVFVRLSERHTDPGPRRP